MASLTFDDQHRGKAVCLAALALLLSNQAHAQQPPGPQNQPAVAFPDAPTQPAPSGYPPNPQAPPPPPPPPPYATTSAPPPAYGPPPGPAPQPSNGYPPPANVAPGQYPPAYPPPGQPQYPPPTQQQYPAQPYPGQQYPAGQPQPYSPPGQPGYQPQAPAGNPPGGPTYANASVEAPAYPPPDQTSSLKIPDFSVRVDPLNWIVNGKLGFELEVEALEWLTIETVPIFVMAREPFSMPSMVQQESNGLGPLSGASLSAGFWLEGDSFRGTVIRAGLTNYSYRYRSFEKLPNEERGSELDQTTLTQTRLSVMLGSGRRFSYFTIAGGFGIEYDLRDERQCLEQQAQWVTKRTGCDRSEYLLRRRKDQPDAANLRGFLYPFEFVFRFSLGVVFDD